MKTDGCCGGGGRGGGSQGALAKSITNKKQLLLWSRTKLKIKLIIPSLNSTGFRGIGKNKKKYVIQKNLMYFLNGKSMTNKKFFFHDEWNEKKTSSCIVFPRDSGRRFFFFSIQKNIRSIFLYGKKALGATAFRNPTWVTFAQRTFVKCQPHWPKSRLHPKTQQPFSRLMVLTFGLTYKTPVVTCVFLVHHKTVRV